MLRQDILRVSLRPGSPLDELGLSERFGLSRSPIREALVRLSSEGLVQILPNRSTIVAPLELQAVPEFLDALDLYQRVTTRSAARFRMSSDLDRIRALEGAYNEAAQLSLDTGDTLPMIDTNYDFHMCIAEAGRNRYYTGFYRRVLNDGRRLLHFYFELQKHDPTINVAKLSMGHREMVEAIERKDEEDAERIAHEHAIQFRGRFSDFLSRNVGSAMQLAELSATSVSDI